MARMYENLEKEAEALVKKAKEQGCWFYNVSFKTWETPESFLELVQSHMIKYGSHDRTIISQYHISDPREGIRIRIAHLNKTSYDLQVFSEKVFAYFNMQSKG